VFRICNVRILRKFFFIISSSCYTFNNNKSEIYSIMYCIVISRYRSIKFIIDCCASKGGGYAVRSDCLWCVCLSVSRIQTWRI